MADVNIYNMADTWNNGATTFTAIKMNVTDTASAAASLLMDLQLGGTSEFQVVKDGQVLSGRTASNSPSYSFVGDPDTGWGYRQADTLAAICGGSEVLRIAPNRVDGLTSDVGASVGGALALGAGGNFDTFLERDAAGVFGQRNGTNAQSSRIYGTYTDGSNYRRLALGMTTAGVATLAPEGAGTGASGNVLHISGLPTSNPGAGILWNNAGTVEVGT